MSNFQIDRKPNGVTITHPDGRKRFLRGIDHIQLVQTLDIVKEAFTPSEAFSTYTEWCNKFLSLYFP